MEQLTPVKDVEKQAVKPPKMWSVIILNDDFTSFDIVIFCLMEYFGKCEEEAERIAMKVHNEGKGVIGVYTKEIAETKQTMAMDFARDYESPLQLVLEEV